MGTITGTKKFNKQAEVYQIMTPNDFFQTIKQYGKIPGGTRKIACELITKMGFTTSKDTVDAWLKGKRSLPIPETVNSINFIQYFNSYTKTTWRDMQQAFFGQDHNGIINCETNDPVIFFSSMLKFFYELIRFFPSSLCHILPEKPVLIGRNNELNQIAEIFKTTNYIVLTGIGGIGKSHIALEYAHILNESNNWIIQHTICEETDTLQKAITRLKFDNLKMPKEKDDMSIFNCKIDALKRSPESKLIVLDNVSQSSISDIDRITKSLTDCGQTSRFLITSRSTLNINKEHIMHILPLENNVLLELYAYYRFEDFSEHKKYIDEHKDILTKIFRLIENHTLMTTLLAKLPNRLFISENEIYEILSDSTLLSSKSTAEKIT